MTTATVPDPLVASPAGRAGTMFRASEEWYVESSALVKLVVLEERSLELHRWHHELEERGGNTFISDLGRIEAHRAIARSDPERAIEAGTIIDDLVRTAVGERDFEHARLLAPPTLRTLDALHLAVVLGFAGPVAGIVTYDRRVIDAARTLGIRTVSP